MTSNRNPEARPIRFERVFDGPVDDLWALWTTKEAFEEWFAPAGCRVEVPVLDLRVGGSFDHVMTALDADSRAFRDRKQMPASNLARGRFIEIIHHRRLHIQFTMDFFPGVAPYPYNMVVDFVPEGDRVRMIVSADAHPDAETTRVASEVLAGELRQFEAMLASRRAKEK